MARIHHVTVINVHDLLDEIALIEQAAALIDVLRSDAVDGLLGVEIGLVFARATARCTVHTGKTLFRRIRCDFRLKILSCQAFD